jgi:UDP-2-acetamido-3-amino-2,3-dideoxy-glucuronate N-acetyltransferase
MVVITFELFSLEFVSSFIHPLADVQSPHIGEGTRIWQFCVVLPSAQIGVGCNLCSHVFVENDVIIGDEVTVKNGVQLWDGLRVEDRVFIGPNVTFTNDRFPRSKLYPDKFPQTIIRQGASIGANSTILPGLVIGRGAMVAAGSVVTRNVPANAIVKGNPARITGFMDTKNQPLALLAPGTVPTVGINEVSFVPLNSFTDIRGGLLAAEFSRHIPFKVVRLFTITNVPTYHFRGDHAHKECHQFLVCLQGSIRAVVDNGKQREEWVLDRPGLGMHIPPMIWGVQYAYAPNTVLLVLASHPYDEGDYIRDYESFLAEVAGA